MARLANSVVYIYLFSFAEAGFVLGFFFVWIYFAIQTHRWLKLFVLRVFPWDFSKNPKGWSDCWSLLSNLCNHAMFWAAFLKLLEGNGWVHLQVNPHKEWKVALNDRFNMCSQACHVWALLSAWDIPQIFSGITDSDTLISGEETPILLARNQQ